MTDKDRLSKKRGASEAEALLQAADHDYNNARYAEAYDRLSKAPPPTSGQNIYGKFFMLRALSQYQLFTTQTRQIKPEEMLKDFKTAQSAMPDNKGVRYYWTMVTGLVMFARKDKEGAIKWFTKARELDSKNNNMANCYLTVVERTSKLGFRELPYCRFAAIGIYNFRAGHLDKAEQAFEKADLIKPDDHITGFFEPYISKLRKEIPHIDKLNLPKNNIATSEIPEPAPRREAHKSEDSKEPGKHLSKPIQADNEEVKRLIAQGIGHLEKDYLRKAIYCFDQARRLNNESIEANYWQLLAAGMSQMKNGELNKASRSFQESLKWKVNDNLATSKLLLMLAILELIKDNIMEAHILLNRAKGYSPNDQFIQSWQIIIECMEKIQQKDLAHANILAKRAEKLDPQNVLIRCFCCIVNGMLGLKNIISEIAHKRHITNVSPKIIKSTLHNFKEASWLNSKVKKAAYLREVVTALELLRREKTQEALLALYNAKRIDPANPLAWKLLSAIEKKPYPHEIDLVKTTQVNVMLESEIDQMAKDIIKVLPADSIDRIVKTDLVTMAGDVATTGEVRADEQEAEESPNVFLSIFTDIEEIDQDHEHLVKLINRLLDDIEGHKDMGVIKSSFDFFKHAVQFHLDFEKRMMEEKGYGEKSSAAHLEDHKNYKNQVNEMGQEIEGYKTGKRESEFDSLITGFIMRHIVDPFMEHIEKYDVPFAEFIKSKR